MGQKRRQLYDVKFSFPHFWILKAWEGRQCLKAEKLKEVNSFQNAQWEDSQILASNSHIPLLDSRMARWQLREGSAIGALLQRLGEALGFLNGLWKEGMGYLRTLPASGQGPSPETIIAR